MESQTTTNSGFFNRIGESVLSKLGFIALFILLLLIPGGWIQDLIQERQNRQKEVMEEVSEKWSGSQLIEGPVLVLPYKTLLTKKDKSGKTSYEEALTNIYILPEVLDIKSKADPQILHRGIFDAVVYHAKIQVEGKFSQLELQKSGIKPAAILWDQAKVVLGLSDLKGLKNNPSIKLGNMNYEVEPDFETVRLFTHNLTIQPNLSAEKNTALDFKFALDLQGSTELCFQHIGKNTTVSVAGNRNNPSFTGRYLPEQRKVLADSFTAVWKMPSFNRPFPQQWVAENTSLNTTKSDAGFGVQFMLPLDQYQKTMRTAKYAVLLILLTFVALLTTELIQKKNVHLLQYALIGAAMTIYYTLLLSFAERIGFNLAYLLASCATIILISTFLYRLLNNRKPALIFGLILAMLYGFIFVIIQLQDLALMFGSIGLFLIITVMMYLSAKMDWSKQRKQIVTEQ
jgi:inner membrane protein